MKLYELSPVAGSKGCCLPGRGAGSGQVKQQVKAIKVKKLELVEDLVRI